MPRLPSLALLVLPLLFIPNLAPAQSDSAPSEISLGATAAKPQPDPTFTPEADPIAPNSPHMVRQTRFEIIRDFETQLVYSRTTFPMGTKGIQLRQGVISPNGGEMRTALAIWGPAIKPGDPAHISMVQIKDDHIHFEINGGPVHHQKWYQRVQISGAGGTVQAPQNNPQSNPHGSYVDLYFAKYVPEMTPEQLRDLLYPVLDFKARNKEQAYLDTVPPKVKEAIVAHNVLVGMNTEMVLHAKGKPPRKVRERDGDIAYEEWIYGAPPADVDFVRIVNDEVVRVETMKIDGEKILRTEKEVILQPPAEQEAKAKQEPEQHSGNAPSLRRPGEDSGEVPKPADGVSPMPPPPPPDIPQPGGGPGEMVSAR
jgi:hypothetical protein